MVFNKEFSVTRIEPYKTGEEFVTTPELFLYLRNQAHERKMVNYIDIVEAFNLPYRQGHSMARQITGALYEILKFNIQHNQPPLTALVVNKTGENAGLPGTGFWNEYFANKAGDLRDVSRAELHAKMVQEVCNFWGTTPLNAVKAPLNLNLPRHFTPRMAGPGFPLAYLSENIEYSVIPHLPREKLEDGDEYLELMEFLRELVYKPDGRIVSGTAPLNTLLPKLEAYTRSTIYARVMMEKIQRLKPEICIQERHYLTYGSVRTRVATWRSTPVYLTDYASARGTVSNKLHEVIATTIDTVSVGNENAQTLGWADSY